MAKKANPVHPGEILKEDFMEPLGLSARALAELLFVPHNRISEIVAKRRAVTADTALRLAKHFTVSAEFWLNLQNRYEMDLARDRSAKELARITRRKPSRRAA